MSDINATERTFIQLDHAAITLAHELWCDDNEQLEAANLTLKMQGMNAGNLHPVEAMRRLAESKFQRDIDELVRTSNIPLYDPNNFTLTRDIKNAWVDKNELVRSLENGAALMESAPASKTHGNEINKFTIPDEPFFQAWHIPETLAQLRFPEDETRRLHAESLYRTALHDAVKSNLINLHDGDSRQPTKRNEIGFTDLIKIDDLIRFAGESGITLEKRVNESTDQQTESAKPQAEQVTVEIDEPETMKKAALIVHLESLGFEDPGAAFRHATGDDGLSRAAKHSKHGFWYVKKAVVWFTRNKPCTTKKSIAPNNGLITSARHLIGK